VNIYRHIDELGRLHGPVHLAIGVFDGVHLGHQAVVTRALRDEGTGAVVTFDQHPQRVLRPGNHPLMLTSTRHRVSILDRIGVAHLLVLRFDHEFARTPADEFIRQLKSACQPLGSIAVGSDWTFGHQGAGNVGLLRAHGIVVHAVEPVMIDGEVASSTLVREAIVNAELERAARFLGRPYSVLGRVVGGERLGRRIGFPTANLEVESEQLPPEGVYAVSARHGGETLRGIANLGRRPTVAATAPTDSRLEVHFFDFDREIYGEDVEVEFRHFLRPERRFDSIDALRAQIDRDAAEGRRVLPLP
jgi:riboflavin kinase/FMN adenylyltransferase